MTANSNRVILKTPDARTRKVHAIKDFEDQNGTEPASVSKLPLGDQKTNLSPNCISRGWPKLVMRP